MDSPRNNIFLFSFSSVYKQAIIVVLICCWLIWFCVRIFAENATPWMQTEADFDWPTSAFGIVTALSRYIPIVR